MANEDHKRSKFSWVKKFMIRSNRITSPLIGNGGTFRNSQPHQSISHPQFGRNLDQQSSPYDLQSLRGESARSSSLDDGGSTTTGPHGTPELSSEMDKINDIANNSHFYRTGDGGSSRYSQKSVPVTGGSSNGLYDYDIDDIYGEGYGDGDDHSRGGRSSLFTDGASTTAIHRRSIASSTDDPLTYHRTRNSSPGPNGLDRSMSGRLIPADSASLSRTSTASWGAIGTSANANVSIIPTAVTAIATTSRTSHPNSVDTTTSSIQTPSSTNNPTNFPTPSSPNDPSRPSKVQIVDSRPPTRDSDSVMSSVKRRSNSNFTVPSISRTSITTVSPSLSDTASTHTVLSSSLSTFHLNQGNLNPTNSNSLSPQAGSASFQLQNIVDTASVITIASSSKKHHRRSSFDTNASTRAIAPESIISRTESIDSTSYMTAPAKSVASSRKISDSED